GVVGWAESSQDSTACTARLGYSDRRERSAQGSGVALIGAASCSTGTDRCLTGQLAQAQAAPPPAPQPQVQVQVQAAAQVPAPPPVAVQPQPQAQVQVQVPQPQAPPAAPAKTQGAL
ncbi:hypothetical protein KI387_037697, partial [Taxus chinensis]